MPFRCSAALLLTLAGALSLSCGGIVGPSQNQVESFSGTVAPGGFSARSFSSSKTGEIAIKIVSLTPASSSVIGVQWVRGDATSCNGAILGNNPYATAGATAISNQILSGSYCVILYDSVGLAQTVTYSVTVSHP